MFICLVQSRSSLLTGIANISLRNLATSLATMTDKKSLPLGAFQLNPLQAPPAFQEGCVQDVSDHEETPVCVDEVIGDRNKVANNDFSDSLIETKTGKELESVNKKGCDIHLKNVTVKQSTLQKHHENVRTSVTHVQAKPTIIPVGLLAEVTQLVKQEKVVVPTRDDGNKISEKVKSAKLSDKPGEDSELIDSGNKTEGKKKRVESADETTRPTHHDLSEVEDFVDPFAQLDIEGLVEANNSILDAHVRVSISKDEIWKEQKREKKKAKEKAWRERKKKFKQKNKDKCLEGEESEDKKSSKPMVNYFVAIQISDPKIKAGLQKVQDDIVSVCGDLAPAMNKITTLHLTLFVASIKTDDEMERSKLALDACQTKLQSMYTHEPLSLDIAGLGHFRHEVLFAKVKSEDQVEQLQHIADTVENCFLDQKITSPDLKGFKPHITIAKLSFMRKRKKKGIKKIDTALFKDYVDVEFGHQDVNTLQLCAMMKKKDDQGYYHVDHTVQFGPEIPIKEKQNKLVTTNPAEHSTDNDLTIIKEKQNKLVTTDSAEHLTDNDLTIIKEKQNKLVITDSAEHLTDNDLTIIKEKQNKLVITDSAEHLTDNDLTVIKQDRTVQETLDDNVEKS